MPGRAPIGAEPPPETAMSDIDARFALAQEIAARAGELALGHWSRRGSLTIESKANALDMVSEADQAVEREIRAAVAAAFPDDGVLGEEYGLEPGTSGFTWVADPIDGTVPFLMGMPAWCVSIAVKRGGETVAGVIAVPTHGETYAARLGAGATLNGARLVIPADVTILNAAVGVGASHRTPPDAAAETVRWLLDRGSMFFRNGSGALMLAYVAAGRLAGYFEPHMHPWDCLAGLLIVREAGGRTAPFGAPDDPTLGTAVLGTAPGAWDDLAWLAGA
jgi:myo-inositol-1(or 4)-monophosphatase